MKSIDIAALGGRMARDVAGIAAAVRDAGGRAFVVGGAVRDLVAGSRDVKDADIEVFGIEPARLQETLSADFRFDACGVSFGVLKLKDVDIDVSLPRRETKYGTGHKGFLVDSDPGLTLPEAAMRRDFTVNAIYLDPLTGRIEDPYGGIEDLESHVLRHVSQKFREDPLRVLRGMQFVSRFSLDPAPETVAVCRGMGMEGLPPERVFGEWEKMLEKGVEIDRGMSFLRDTGWVRYFPELEALIGCEQDPHWHLEGDVWNHTCMCLDAFARDRKGDKTEDVIVGLAVLCHDFGKPATTVFSGGRIRSPGHDEAGVEPTLSFLRRLTNEERILKEVPPLVKCHMQPFSLWKSKAGDGAVRRLAAKVSRIDRLLRVVRADDEGRPPLPSGPTSGADALKWLEERAAQLEVKDSAPKPVFMGRHLIELGYRPSEKFGEWLSAVYEAQLDGRFSDTAGATEYFRKHFA